MILIYPILLKHMICDITPISNEVTQLIKVINNTQKTRYIPILNPLSYINYLSKMDSKKVKLIELLLLKYLGYQRRIYAVWVFLSPNYIDVLLYQKIDFMNNNPF